jgi:putative cell wall-binding protein
MAAALVAVAALLAAPVTAASASPTTESVRDSRATARPVAPVEPLIPMAEVRVADFAAEAAELPSQLQQALARDVGMTGAEWLAQAEASAVGVKVVDALRDHVDVRAARLDGLELVVTVGSTADAAVVESVGASAEIGPEPARLGEPIEGLEPAADLRGGMPYDYPPGFRCSIGFIGLDSTTLQTQMMSAGHCEGTPSSTRSALTINRPTISGGTVSLPRQTIGVAGLHVTDQYPNPSFPSVPTFYDLGITPVTGSGWTPKPEIVTWGQTTSGAPLATDPLVIRDAGPTIAGATICKSGATSGWTCGLVTRVDAVLPVGAFSLPPDDPDADPCDYLAQGSYCVGSIDADICVRSGDSGGPAIVGHTAVGITSAATNGAVGTCDVAGNEGVFATLYSANPAYERVTKLYPRWEPLIAVSTPSVTINDQVLSGTLEHGTTRHFIDVVLSTGEKFTTQVQADGSWSVNTASATPVTKTYTVTARWGKGSKSTPVSGTLPGIATERLFGSDRYATSVLISKNEFPGSPTPNSPRPEGVPVVYLANGASFPDALSAGPAAALEGGPLLLTPSSSLPASVAAELDRLNPTRIVIVGGTGVVSPAVAAAAAAYTPNPVIRLGGANRYETSRLIAQRMLSQGLATGQSLWVATGRNFPDALSAGAAAASQRVPILLVNGTASTLDSATSAFINGTLQSNRVYIAGGTGVVSEGIRIGIQNLASTGVVSREGGADRFATSLEINGAAFTGTAPEVFIAYGFNFPDALSGSVIAGLRGGPLYITRTTCVTPAIVSQIRTLDPSKLTVFGGTAIVSNNARDLKTC